MLNIEFKRNQHIVRCGSCEREVNVNEPSYSLEFGVQNYIIAQAVCLCEDCGNRLQNDMSQVFGKFIELEL